jgi:hypothetical protein
LTSSTSGASAVGMLRATSSASSSASSRRGSYTATTRCAPALRAARAARVSAGAGSCSVSPSDRSWATCVSALGVHRGDDRDALPCDRHDVDGVRCIDDGPRTSTQPEARTPGSRARTGRPRIAVPARRARPSLSTQPGRAAPTRAQRCPRRAPLAQAHLRCARPPSVRSPRRPRTTPCRRRARLGPRPSARQPRASRAQRQAVRSRIEAQRTRRRRRGSQRCAAATKPASARARSSRSPAARSARSPAATACELDFVGVAAGSARGRQTRRRGPRPQPRARQRNEAVAWFSRCVAVRVPRGVAVADVRVEAR